MHHKLRDRRVHYNDYLRKTLNKRISVRELVFAGLAILCISSLVSPPMALLFGILTAWFIGHPYLHLNHKITHFLLQASVVGLGFGMDAGNAFKAGQEGIMFTVASILATLIMGYLLCRLFAIDKKTAYLVTVGTAICGGSAIAAIAPVIRAKEKQVSVALGVVFMLNALALFVFPLIGHALGMSQEAFGLWSAVAIHDTSSVVGAAGRYGAMALETATTVKLARALWIIPLALISSMAFGKKGRKSKIKIPYFIGLFILGMLLHTYVPAVRHVSPYITSIASSGLTLTLFLIGCGLTRKVIGTVGGKLLLLGLVLWIFTAVLSLCGLIFFVS